MSKYRRKDHYYRKAKGEGYLSRAAYKLIQVNSKAKIIKRGDVLVDVGCSPGGWSQVALEAVGAKGKVIGIDILDDCAIRSDNFQFLNRDVMDDGCAEYVLKLAGGKVDAVISDAAPNTTGVKFTDHARSVDLVAGVLEFAAKVLRRGGNFLVKVFDGPDTGELLREMKKLFESASRLRPGATRKESFEIYLIGKGFRPGGREEVN
ncbi:MAG: RlmE family RNA methyltransferase [Deltaproteobacteria bacterium]|nr:RlmE family RNA methyltransferase [Deltaproteobacteria bacterium]NIS77939.1 RlmE family RNA methyltransferase [Deltaproteobacteria bacterium]